MIKPPYTDPDGTLHETYSASIFVQGRFLGSFSYDSGRSDLLYYRTGFSFFCRECGQIWAAIVASQASGAPCSYTLVHVGCEGHGDHWRLAGSLLQGHLENLLEDLPPAAVEREFELHLNQAEKELASCQN